MAEPISTSGALAELILITERRPEGIPLGMAQNWSVNVQYHSEVHQACGRQVPQESRFHGTGPGTLQWTTIKLYDPESLERYGVLPASINLQTFKPWTLIVYDLVRGEYITKAVDCVPTSQTISGSPATSLTSNASFMVREFKSAEDLN